MNSFTTTRGQVIPTESESQVRDAIRLADKAHQDVGDGGGWDDPRLRAHLTARAKAHGIPHIIPARWGTNGSAKSAYPANVMIKMRPDGRVEVETSITTDRQALAKSRFALPWERSVPPQETAAGVAFVKSQQCRDAAMKAIDPETRDMYLTAARELRKEAGLA